MELWHLGEYDDEKGTIKDNKYIIKDGIKEEK